MLNGVLPEYLVFLGSAIFTAIWKCEETVLADLWVTRFAAKAFVVIIKATAAAAPMVFANVILVSLRMFRTDSYWESKGMQAQQSFIRALIARRGVSFGKDTQ